MASTTQMEQIIARYVRLYVPYVPILRPVLFVKLPL